LLVGQVFIRHGQVQRSHTVIILQMQSIRIGINQEFDNLGAGAIGGGHVKGQGSVLIADGSTLGMTGQQDFHGFYRSLPHGCLMNGQVADAVGLRGATGVGFEQGFHHIGGGLETASCVQR
jgi:hypothetical protein